MPCKLIALILLQISIGAILTLTEHCEIDESVEITFEKPFCMTTHFSTPVDTYILMPPQDQLLNVPIDNEAESKVSSSAVHIPLDRLVFLTVSLETLARCQLEVCSTTVVKSGSSDVQVSSLRFCLCSHLITNMLE